MSRSSLRRAGGLGYQRLRFVEVRGIGAGARLELLRAATEDFRREEAPFRIRRELVHGPEQTGHGAMRAPRIQEVPLQVVLQELVERTREHPQELVVADANVVRLL